MSYKPFVSVGRGVSIALIDSSSENICYDVVFICNVLFFIFVTKNAMPCQRFWDMSMSFLYYFFKSSVALFVGQTCLDTQNFRIFISRVQDGCHSQLIVANAKMTITQYIFTDTVFS